MIKNPRSVRLEASTICQLKCPCCPTAKGEIDEKIGSGFLKLEDFKAFLKANPSIRQIELSNYGEIFLNPELLGIMQYAYERDVALCVSNGANLNNARNDVLEGLVKYKVREITCSIDGATDEVYKIYRVKGNLQNVLNNIETINHFKQKYNSTYPYLLWQFIVFGHNEHEIEQAKQLAAKLNMEFVLKLNDYDSKYSPVSSKELVRDEVGASDVDEYYERNKRPYFSDICLQLWKLPQINFDGNVLGCCVNYWGSFGNAFTGKLSDILNSEKMNYARSMLMGEAEERSDIPCTTCGLYKQMKKHTAWIEPAHIKEFNPDYCVDVKENLLPEIETIEQSDIQQISGISFTVS